MTYKTRVEDGVCNHGPHPLLEEALVVAWFDENCVTQLLVRKLEEK